MMSEKVILKLNDGLAEITLNNPAKLNCMGFEMLHAMEEAIDKAAKDMNVRTLLFSGAGDRAFSTGADLKEFRSLSPEKADEWIEYGNLVFNKIEKLPKPTVAFINGYAIGGGLELALACDIRIGAKTAVLASVELQHGWLPGWGGMTRLRKLIGEARAKEMIMLCDQIQAEKALDMGLLTKIVDDAGGEEMVTLLKHLASINPKAFKLAKAALMDPDRSTEGSDLQFDVLAMNLANSRD
jgi:enoyl-CoA hydratase/carnithine racemase